MKVTQENWLDVLKKTVAGRGEQNAFALRHGINQSALSKLLNGKLKRPSNKLVQQIVLALNAEYRESSINSGQPGPHMATINVYAVAGAGPARLPEQMEPLFEITAPEDYLRRSDYAVVIEGASMVPVIPNGSVVGIKTNEPFRANELYLANIPYEGLIVKRVGVDRSTNEFIFKSENPDKETYPDFRLSIAESENIIVGRVVWSMIRY